MSRHRAEPTAAGHKPSPPVVAVVVRRFGVLPQAWMVDRRGFAMPARDSSSGRWLQPWAAPRAVKAWRARRERLIPR